MWKSPYLNMYGLKKKKNHIMQPGNFLPNPETFTYPQYLAMPGRACGYRKAGGKRKKSAGGIMRRES